MLRTEPSETMSQIIHSLHCSCQVFVTVMKSLASTGADEGSRHLSLQLTSHRHLGEGNEVDNETLKVARAGGRERKGKLGELNSTGRCLSFEMCSNP